MQIHTTISCDTLFENLLKGQAEMLVPIFYAATADGFPSSVFATLEMNPQKKIPRAIFMRGVDMLNAS
jgi:hypothetical protein